MQHNSQLQLQDPPRLRRCAEGSEAALATGASLPSQLYKEKSPTLANARGGSWGEKKKNRLSPQSSHGHLLASNHERRL